ERKQTLRRARRRIEAVELGEQAQERDERAPQLDGCRRAPARPVAIEARACDRTLDALPRGDRRRVARACGLPREPCQAPRKPTPRCAAQRRSSLRATTQTCGLELAVIPRARTSRS